MSDASQPNTKAAAPTKGTKRVRDPEARTEADVGRRLGVPEEADALEVAGMAARQGCRRRQPTRGG